MAAIDSSFPTQNPHLHHRPQPTTICLYWLQGRCTRDPCKFLHPQKPTPTTPPTTTSNTKDTKTICKYWASGKCDYQGTCRFLHAWFYSVGEKFSRLTRLTGHVKPVTGIALPEGSKLYTSSLDGTVRVWDCHTGSCVHVADAGTEVVSLISEGSWLFLGLKNTVKAWRLDHALGFEKRQEFCLDGPVGRARALATSDDILFAGSEDGSISAWRCNGSGFLKVPSLLGHKGPVVSLRVGAGKLFSGSMDGSIRAWDLKDLRCLYAINAHNGAVTSLICWDKFLLSSSVDRTVKIWGATEGGGLELLYTHQEEVGVVSLFGMLGPEDKPVLYCSCEDSSVGLFVLPSFVCVGRIFGRIGVGPVQSGPGGLFFTGDGTGLVGVWKWALE